MVMVMKIRMRNEKKIRRFCKRNIRVVRHGLFEGPRKWNKKTWEVLMMRRKKDEKRTWDEEKGERKRR